MKNNNYVYFAEIERFGYTLQVIGRTEKECKDAMINEYVRTYKDENGVDPRKGDEIDKEYFDTFMDEMNIEKREFGKIEWR